MKTIYWLQMKTCYPSLEPGKTKKRLERESTKPLTHEQWLWEWFMNEYPQKVAGGSSS